MFRFVGMSFTDTSAAVVAISTLVGLWIIVSVPVYVSAKILTAGRARFTQALGATVLGPLVYAGVLIAVTVVVGSFAPPLAFLLMLPALIAWIWVFKTIFKTGWLAAIGIAALAVIVFIGAGFLITLALIIFVPALPPQPLPMPLRPV